MTVRAHRFVAAGALAVAAVAAPIAMALTSGNTAAPVAGPACLAWFGNKEDGKCLSYSNGNGVNVGTPVYNGGTSPNSGWSSGPLLPGQTWNIPLEWSLKAQLVFGGPQEGARENLAPRAEQQIAGGRLFVHGKSA